MAKIHHKFFKTFQNYQRLAVLVIFTGLFGFVGWRVLQASFAQSSTSTINGYKVNQTGQPSSTQAAIANVPVEYTCCTLSGNSSPQSANPYSFSNLPQGFHRISINKSNVPAGWVPLFSHCWEDGSCPHPNPTKMAYEAGPNIYTVVIDTRGHTVAHLWFNFRQNPPAVSLLVNPSSIAYGGSTTINWNSTNSPTTCSNNFGGPGNASGSMTISNLTASRSFTVTCSNSGGTGSNTKSVTVGAKPSPPPSNPPPSSVSSPKPPVSTSSQKPNNNQPNSVATDATAPSVPSSFKAEPHESEPSIELRWEASTDAVGLKGYQLERSTDQQNWTTLDPEIQQTYYTDQELTFSTHYYYRLKAIDTSNNASSYTTVDTTTVGFQSNITKKDGGTITSEDKLVSVTIPADAFDQDTYCDVIDPRAETTKVKGFELAAGFYQLRCQAPDGTLLTDLKRPATVRIELDAGRRKKYTELRYYVNNGDQTEHVLGQNDSFELSRTSSFALYGKPKATPIWIKIIIVLVIIIGIGVLFVGFLYRRKRRGLEAKAEDFWRKSKGLE